MLDWLLPTVLGVISGGAAGWVSAYLNLDVAIRKSRSERRRELIDFWRTEILAKWTASDRALIPPTGHAICKLPAYDSLRPHLSADLVKSLEGEQSDGLSGTIVVVLANGDIQLRQRVVEEIGLLEKAWKVI